MIHFKIEDSVTSLIILYALLCNQALSSITELKSDRAKELGF